MAAMATGTACLLLITVFAAGVFCKVEGDDNVSSNATTSSTVDANVTSASTTEDNDDWPPQECFCSKEKEPVCDTFGREYSNECVMRCLARTDSSIILACHRPCPCNKPIHAAHT